MRSCDWSSDVCSADRRLPPIGWDGGSCLAQYCLKPFMPRLELAEFLPVRLKIETCLFARRVAREEQLIITLARHKHGAGGSRGHGAYPYCPAIAPAAEIGRAHV